MKRYLFALLFLASFLLSPLYAQVNESTVVPNLATQVVNYPQEKIYIQTDKPYYINGEKLYFRAFLVHASFNKPLYLSRYIYVELINPVNETVLRQKIRLDENNMLYGYLSIPEDLAEGYYRIRSYSRYMENMGEESFFTRPVFIADPNATKNEMETDIEYLSDKQIQVGLRFKDYKTKINANPQLISLHLEGDKKTHNLQPDAEGWVYQKFDLRDMDTKRTLLIEYRNGGNSFSKFVKLPYYDNDPELNFYPEGGHIITGTENRIAFKALLPDGLPAIIDGNIVDAKGNNITHFSTIHDGMGDFRLTPAAGETYYAQYTYNNRTINEKLPEAKADYAGIKAYWEGDKLFVSLNTNQTAGQKLYLLGTRQGVPFIFEEWRGEDKSFSQNIFKTGVSHLMLLNQNLQIVSERLVFCNQEDKLAAEILTNKERYKSREQIKVDIQFPTLQIDTVPITFAVSITDDKDIQLDKTSNILSEILLTSELKGTIHNPAWYFDSRNEETTKAADLLMLTNGWRRYYVEEALQGNIRRPTIMPEQSQVISGELKNLRNRPEGKGIVQISALGYDYREAFEADDKGRFYVDGLDFPDSTAFFFYGNTKKRTLDVKVIVDTLTYPGVSLFDNKGYISANEKFTEPNFVDYIAKADRKYLQEAGTRMVYLDEITVTGKKKKDHRRMDNLMSMQSDRFVSPDEIEASPPMNFEDLFYRLRGVSSVDPDGVSSFGGYVGFIVNGMKFENDYQALQMRLNVEDIAQLELFTDITEGLVYGFSGPFIAITTWPPGYNRKNSSDNGHMHTAVPLGAQNPVEFYSPRYDSPESRFNPSPDLRSTIYWKPDIMLQNTNKTSIDFYSADTPTTYSILIEGIGNNRNFIYQREERIITVE